MDLLERLEIVRSQGGKSFRIMTWNLLADQLANDFPAVDEKYLAWDYRKNLILQEISRLSPDILCVQELDHFQDFLLPFLQSQGFEGIFRQKSGWHNDGLAIFYKTAEFTKVEEYFIQYPGSQFAIGLQLQHEASKKNRFYVFTTHLKAKIEFDLERVNQITEMFRSLALLENLPLIIGGDFNSSPGSNAYHHLLNNGLNLTSVYNTGNEPEYTTVKFRSSLEIKTEDYIWQRGFEIRSFMSIPTLELIGNNGLPSANYPSDHFSLAADLFLA